ncbi:SRPBCC family protein [Thioclava pacifica]|uniref:Activator of Hsp90 ATPase homologue 1/2-like C-terminal domain-containing protein n=1 Tax=Thioclava pacifica DSM 10166 TaxID=1353537 RepID=A0A074J6K2_9RHOB|nr:SRPBCC family protein [Thioclava pacifica]KEO51233.1 hypothetical protein TP2_12630 [Thioclava pacifica DSM 10166]
MSTDLDLILTRQVKASPATAYRCRTEPELLMQFFAPKPGRTTEARVDLRPGGAFYTKMEFEQFGEIETEGCYLIVEPAKRLVFTDCLTAEFRPSTKPFFTADLSFTETDQGCEYRVIARHGSEDSVKRHLEMGFHEGWGTVAGQLAALAESLDAA